MVVQVRGVLVELLMEMVRMATTGRGLFVALAHTDWIQDGVAALDPEDQMKM